MIRFLLTTVTGWTAVLATGIEIALPFLIRNPPLKASAEQMRPNLRANLWPHYWLGYLLLALVLAHASFVMGPAMGRADAVGIWSATLAFCLLLLQVALGLPLKNQLGGGSQLRRWHFWNMIAFVGLVSIHLVRNV